MTKAYIVGVYELDRAYGGAEEGGWWYDTGELVRICRVFRNHESASDYAYRMNRTLQYRIKKSRSVPYYSVIYSGGAYQAQVYINELPKFYPSERPYYS